MGRTKLLDSLFYLSVYSTWSMERTQGHLIATASAIASNANLSTYTNIILSVVLSY